MNQINYKQSGVDIDAANAAKLEMAKSMATNNTRVLHKQGSFAALYDIQFPEYRQPVLVLKTEEPGSKQLLAFQHGRVESICYDMVNHLVNDCIVMGAKPLTVQDAIICGKLEPQVVTKIVATIVQACAAQDCVLTGGETSEQPGMLAAGTYVLTSSIVGIVEKDEIIDGAKIEVGDMVIGLESSGLHTNGYTLIRKLTKLFPDVMHGMVAGRPFLDVILEPHQCYYQTIKDLFKTGTIHGMAHITGGGIKENLNRILPEGKDAVIDLSQYHILPIFTYVKEKGALPDAEMLRTFNMSIGLVLVVKKEHVETVLDHIKKRGVHCYEIGTIVPGTRQVQTVGSFQW